MLSCLHVYEMLNSHSPFTDCKKNADTKLYFRRKRWNTACVSRCKLSKFMTNTQEKGLIHDRYYSRHPTFIKNIMKVFVSPNRPIPSLPEKTLGWFCWGLWHWPGLTSGTRAKHPCHIPTPGPTEKLTHAPVPQASASPCPCHVSSPPLHPIPALPLPSAPRARTSGISNFLHFPPHPHCLLTSAISLAGTACTPRLLASLIARAPPFSSSRPGPAHRSRTWPRVSGAARCGGCWAVSAPSRKSRRPAPAPCRGTAQAAAPGAAAGRGGGRPASRRTRPAPPPPRPSRHRRPQCASAPRAGPATAPPTVTLSQSPRAPRPAAGCHWATANQQGGKWPIRARGVAAPRGGREGELRTPLPHGAGWCSRCPPGPERCHLRLLRTPGAALTRLCSLPMLRT